MPTKKQYFFPENFKKYKIFSTFYQPYNKYGRIGWFIFSKIPLVYKIFKEKNIDKYIPMDLLVDFIDNDSIFSINLGTKGLERKITIIGQSLKTKEKYFIKFGDSDVSKKIINNEIEILTEKSDFDFIPLINKYHQCDAYSIFKTNFINGKKITNNYIDNKIFKILFHIGNSGEIKKNRHGLYTSFSHGDFCPWNIIAFNNSIKVIDWELAGYYPLGYDLFTFIFQYYFLINKNISIESYLMEKKDYIIKYFNVFSIANWRKYLVEFAKLKIVTEKNKNNIILEKKYSILHEISKEI